MAYPATVFRVLIASPGDVTDEREMLSRTIFEWNSANSAHLSAALIPVRWEVDSTPALGDRPQAILNDQIVSSSDILIGVFWTRIGTRTGVAESGTVEEIEEFLAGRKPVLLYFSAAPIQPDRIDHDQYARLVEFKGKLLKRGLVESYGSLDELREKINRHLTNVVRNLKTGMTESTSIPPSSTIRNPLQIADALGFERRRRDFLNSREGVQAAINEVQILNLEVQRMVEALNDPNKGLAFSVSLAPDGATVAGSGYSLSFGWALQYSDSLEHSGLLVVFWKGYLRIGNRVPVTPAEELLEEDYDFDITPSDQMGWRERDGEDRFFTSKALVESAFSQLLDQIHSDLSDRD